MKYKYNPPYLVKKIFRSFQWESKCNKALLTFDDGPIPQTTELILKKLNEDNLKAVFFCVGDNIRKFPDLAEAIISEGHTIGNHTFNHKKLTGMNREESIKEIVSFNNLLQDNFNFKVKYFRPPYGRFNLSTSFTLKKMNLQNVMWSLLTYDFKNDFSVVKSSVNYYLKNNSIIILHDSIKS